jgi:hypothetical protein
MVPRDGSELRSERSEAGSQDSRVGETSEPLVPLWAVQAVQLCGVISFLIGMTDQVPGLWLVGGCVLTVVLGIYIWDGPNPRWRVRQLLLASVVAGGFAIVSPPWYRGALLGVMFDSLALGAIRVGFDPLYPNAG